MTLAAANEDTRPWLTVETLLYVGLACLALAVRLWGLGYQPLSDAESHDALLAFRFLRGAAAPASATAATPTSPLLYSLTSLAFLMFGASDTTARLAPALAGSLLALTPACLRRHLGRLPALGMAALMALSPSLIAASRAADAATLAALAVMVLLGSLLEYGATGDRRHLFAAAVAAGAGLGPPGYGACSMRRDFLRGRVGCGRRPLPACPRLAWPRLPPAR
jgi:predicted membrane-bound mannosyltransferase